MVVQMIIIYLYEACNYSYKTALNKFAQSNNLILAYVMKSVGNFI